MATLKSGSTVGGSLVLTNSTHGNTGDPHDQYKLISELVAEYYDKTQTDALLALKVDLTQLPSLEQDKLDAEAAAAAAALSETNAANSASSASTSASQAATSASNANTSAVEAAASEANAALSEIAAGTSETNAAASAAAALTSETNAAASESAAATSASNAATSETNAQTAETGAVAAQSYAEEWANKAEDSLVSVAAGGDGVNDYSALHWANKAAQSAIDAATFDPSSYYNKTEVDGFIAGVDTKAEISVSLVDGQDIFIPLSSSVSTPVVSVTKETPQVGVTNNSWTALLSDNFFDVEDFAHGGDLIISATPTVSLSAGVFTSEDVGKTLIYDGGVAVLYSGSQVDVIEGFDTPTTIPAGEWKLVSGRFDAGSFKVQGSFEPSNINTLGGNSKLLELHVATSRAARLSPTGDRLFYMSNGAIYQYTLSTPWEIDTGSYDNVFFGPTGGTQNLSFFVSRDGTRLYNLDGSVDVVYWNTLSTPWDLSTISSETGTASVSEATSPRDIWMDPTERYMYILDFSSDNVYQYELSTPGDITTSSYTGKSFSVSAQDTSPQCLTFSITGTKMYVGGAQDYIDQFSLATPWDVSTASADNVLKLTGSNPESVFFKEDSTKMYTLIPTTADILQYDFGYVRNEFPQDPAVAVTSLGQINTEYWTDLNSITATDTAEADSFVNYAFSTDDKASFFVPLPSGERPIVRNNAGTWQINTAFTSDPGVWVDATTNTMHAAIREARDSATGDSPNSLSNFSYTGNFLDISANTTSNVGGSFSEDGTNFYVTSSVTDTVLQYALSTPWDLTSGTYFGEFSTLAQSGTPYQTRFKSDGTKMYVLDFSAGVFQYTLTTPWDVTTATYDNISLNLTIGSFFRSMDFSTSGDKLYILDNNSSRVVPYTLSTPWDLSTATADGANAILTALGSTIYGLSISSDGESLYALDENTQTVGRFRLLTPWDVTGMSLVSTVDMSTEVGPNLRDIHVVNNDSQLLLGAQSAIYSGTITEPAYRNRVTSEDLSALSDSQLPVLNNTLDMAMIIATDEGYRTAQVDGVSLNYDANVTKEAALLGVDYTFYAPDTTAVQLRGLVGNNINVRIL